MRAGGFRLPGALALLAMTAGAGFSQAVISTQAGLINFTQEGVRLNNQAIEQKSGQLQQMREGDVLSTARGLAEVLLTPGVFLRAGGWTSFRLVSSRLADARVQLTSGVVILEAAQLDKDNSVTLSFPDGEVSILKRGIYRLDANPPVARVFDGKLLIRSGGRQVEIGKGKAAAVDGTLAVSSFDRKRSDWLDLWSRERAVYLARLNRSTAYSLSDQRGSIRTSGWIWDPIYSTFTFLPGRNYQYCSWYGSCWYSPLRIYYASAPAVTAGDGGWSAGRGGGGGGSGSSISAGTYSSSSPGATGTVSRETPTAPSSAPAPSRGGGRSDP